MEQPDLSQDGLPHSSGDVFAQPGDSHGFGDPLHTEGTLHTGFDFSGIVPEHGMPGHWYEQGLDSTYLGGSQDLAFNTTLDNLFEQPLSDQASALEQLIPLVKDYAMQLGTGDELVSELNDALLQAQSGSPENMIEIMEETQQALQEAYDFLGPALFIEGTSSIGFS